MSKSIYSESVNYGQNKETPKYRDDRYVRCARCGWINHLDRERRAPEGSKIGWGINYQTTGVIGYDEVTVGYDDSLVEYDGRTISDPVVISGCSQCGTLLYDK